MNLYFWIILLENSHFIQYKQIWHVLLINLCRFDLKLNVFFLERYSLAKAMDMLGLIGGDNSEDLSDINDPVGDAEYLNVVCVRTPFHRPVSK